MLATPTVNECWRQNFLVGVDPHHYSGHRLFGYTRSELTATEGEEAPELDESKTYSIRRRRCT